MRISPLCHVSTLGKNPGYPQEGTKTLGVILSTFLPFTVLFGKFYVLVYIYVP